MRVSKYACLCTAAATRLDLHTHTITYSTYTYVIHVYACAYVCVCIYNKFLQPPPLLPQSAQKGIDDDNVKRGRQAQANVSRNEKLNMY